MNMPNFSHVAQRGEIIGNTLEKAMNIIGQTMTTSVQQYQQNRNLETAYKGVRGMILDTQDKYGLSDEQADAMMSKLKYRQGETIEQYENRIRPTLFNMTLYNTYKKEDPNFDVDMPDPFLDQESFITAMGHFAKIKKQRELGEAVQDYYLGESLEGPRASTQEQMGTMVAGRMGGRPVTQQELEQFPEYRALPSQADIVKQEERQLKQQQLQQEETRKQEMHEVDIGAKKSLTTYRNTAARVKALSGTGNKKNAVDKIKDIASIAKLEIAANEMLKDMIKTDPQTGEISEEWLNMKELAGVLKEKRTELTKKPGTVEPSMEATSEANKIQGEISRLQASGSAQEGDDLQLTSRMIYDFAKSKGITMDFQKIKSAIEQGSSVVDIIERILMATKQQQPGAESGG